MDDMAKYVRFLRESIADTEEVVRTLADDVLQAEYAVIHAKELHQSGERSLAKLRQHLADVKAEVTA